MGYENDVIVGGVYKHFKGNVYTLLEVAKHCETLIEFAVYKGLHNSEVWVRPLSEFVGKTADGVKRFVKI